MNWKFDRKPFNYWIFMLYYLYNNEIFMTCKIDIKDAQRDEQRSPSLSMTLS